MGTYFEKDEEFKARLNYIVSLRHSEFGMNLDYLSPCLKHYSSVVEKGDRE